MWLFVFFDLPTGLPQERKDAQTFRKHLEEDGFTMMQFSVYIRHCSSLETANVHIKRVKGMMPEKGKVSVLMITDKQYSKMYNFFGLPRKCKTKDLSKKIITMPLQLEFF